MKRTAWIGSLLFIALVGCSDDVDGDPNSDEVDVGVEDAGGDQDIEDASQQPDADGDADAGGEQDIDAGQDAGAEDTGAAQDAGGEDTGVEQDADVGEDIDDGPVCGDGIVEDGETCDDGIIEEGCDTYHDGGDGFCRPPGECSEDYILDEDGACVPAELDEHIHIYVDNFCNLSVDPEEVHVAPGQTATFVYHNHSVDYAVDVWGFYGGGHTDLSTGAQWDDSFIHCANVNRPSSAFMDISISGLGMSHSSCPGHRFMIFCE